MAKSQVPHSLAKAAALAIAPVKRGILVDVPTHRSSDLYRRHRRRRVFPQDRQSQPDPFHPSVIRDHRLQTLSLPKSRLWLRNEPHVRIAAAEFPNGVIRSRKREVEVVNEVLSDVPQ
jgi:hypothetical protein